MKQVFTIALLASTILTACSKKDEMLLDKEPKSGQIGKFTEEELGGAAGWEAMNIFREKKDSIATYSVSYDDLTISRGLWLMETTLNYDHAQFTDTTLLITDTDTINFNISLTGEGTHLSGTATLQNYLTVETNVTNLGSEYSLILADFEFIETKDGRAFFRVVRSYGVSASGSGSAPPNSRAMYHGWPCCGDTSTCSSVAAWGIILKKLPNPSNPNVYAMCSECYYSNFTTNWFHQSNVPSGYLWQGHKDDCISYQEYLTYAKWILNDFATNLSATEHIVGKNFFGVFNGPSFALHGMWAKTGKLQNATE